MAFYSHGLEVSLRDLSSSGLTIVRPYNDGPAVDCSSLRGVGGCAWAAIEINGTSWLNATVLATRDGRRLELTAAVGHIAPGLASVTASSYGWGGVPMMAAYDGGTDLPVLSWNRSLAPGPFGFNLSAIEPIHIAPRPVTCCVPTHWHACMRLCMCLYLPPPPFRCLSELAELMLTLKASELPII